MPTKDFRDRIEERFGVAVCVETACVRLHDLGFTQKHHHKTNPDPEAEEASYPDPEAEEASYPDPEAHTNTKQQKQTVYFDGHEREDVVAYRKEYVDKMAELDRRCLYPGHTPELLLGEKPLIQIHHDESTFYANADQSSHWG